MNKRFPVEPFEYEGEDEVRVRNHIVHPVIRSIGRRLPVGTAQSRWPWQDPRGRSLGRSRAAFGPRRRNRRFRFPVLPFPSQLGCSCDPPPLVSQEPIDEPQPPAPVVVDAAPGAPAGAPLATPGDGGAAEYEFDPWDHRANRFRARRRRRAGRGSGMGFQRQAFSALPFPFELEADDANGATATAPPRLGTLTVTATGRHRFSYTFTPEDLLWTARFIVGEAGGADNLDSASVIWAMFNRFGLFTHSRYPTFHQFLRAYSTPLQRVLHSSGAARRHMDDPQFVKTGETYPGTQIPKGQLRRFLQLQNRPWEQLPQPARALAARALQGGVPNAIGNATEFASTVVYFHDRHGKRAQLDDTTWRRFTQQYAASKHWTWIGDVAGLNQRNNAFFVDQRVAALPAGAVRVSA